MSKLILKYDGRMRAWVLLERMEGSPDTLIAKFYDGSRQRETSLGALCVAILDQNHERLRAQWGLEVTLT